MKAEKRRVFFVAVLTAMLWVALFLSECRADDFNVWTDFFKFDEIELAYPGSFISAHKDQCAPRCWNQKNGGYGGRVGIFGGFNVVNSYEDPARIRFVEVYNFEINYESTQIEFFKAVKFELPIWIMWIDGYFVEERTTDYYVDSNGEARNVKEYKPITIGPFPWAIQQVAVNPVFIVEKIFDTKISRGSDEYWIKCNILDVPGVRIQWVSFEYNHKFKAVLK